MRGDGGVVDDDLGIAHQLLAAFHVAGKAHQGVHHPELGDGQRHFLALPAHAHALGLDAQVAFLVDAVGSRRLAHGFHASEQGADARGQLMEGDILGQIVIGTEAQAGNHVEIRIACSQEDDRQGCRLGAQVAAQVKAAFGLVAEADIDDDQFRHAPGKRALGFDTTGIAAHVISGAGQCFDIVGPDQRLVFDDGDAARHGRTPFRCSELTQRHACAAMRQTRLPAKRHN